MGLFARHQFPCGRTEQCCYGGASIQVGKHAIIFQNIRFGRPLATSLKTNCVQQNVGNCPPHECVIHFFYNRGFVSGPYQEPDRKNIVYPPPSFFSSVRRRTWFCLLDENEVFLSTRTNNFRDFHQIVHLMWLWTDLIPSWPQLIAHPSWFSSGGSEGSASWQVCPSTSWWPSLKRHFFSPFWIFIVLKLSTLRICTFTVFRNGKEETQTHRGRMNSPKLQRYKTILAPCKQET